MLGTGQTALDGSCRLFTRFGGVKTLVIRLAGADAARLLQLGKLRIGWVACQIREHAEVARCFTLEELKRAGGRLEARTAPGIDGVPNEILKEVIGAYPEILLEAFNFCLQEGRFFADWKKQRLVLLRKGNKPQGSRVVPLI